MEKADNGYVCKIPSPEEINGRWDDEIARHADKRNWLVWRDEAMDHYRTGRSIPYYGILNGTVICEATAVPDPDSAWNKKRPDERTVELCAFRTVREYRGMGWFSKLMDFMLRDLRQRGFTRAVVGVEPCEARNRAIYRHWGFTEHVGDGTETYPDGTVIEVLFFAKPLQRGGITAH